MTNEEATAREAIRKTINAYTIAGDSRDSEAFPGLFAIDAVFEFAGFAPLPGFRREGRDAIRSGIATWSQEPGKDPSLTRTAFIRHNLTTCQIELTGDNIARARTYFIVMTEIGPDHSGVYSDMLKRYDDNWLFTHRRITLDWRSPESLFPPV
ncbi:MAG: nuclear transport factor 2 family protein [Novosphingobium sp.]|nr:nuclear transport factor 2 family protein [Novosphingobium sp.]